MIFIKGDIHPLLMYIITNFASYNVVMENLFFITLYILHMDVMCLKTCMKHIQVHERFSSNMKMDEK